MVPFQAHSPLRMTGAFEPSARMPSISTLSGTDHPVDVDQRGIAALRLDLVLAERCAIKETLRIALAKSNVAGGILVEQRVVEEHAGGRYRRGMRHQRHFAETACALVGVEHLVEHGLALRSLRLDDPPAFEAHLDIVDQRALMAESGLVEETWPSTFKRMRRGEDLFRRNVRVAGHAVFRRRGAAMPFMSVGETHRQIGAGTCEMQRCRSVRRSARWSVSSVPHYARAQAATGSSRSTREAAKIASASLRTASSIGMIRENELRPGRVRIGADVPVDVEIGDMLQRRLVGDRGRLVGTADLGRVFARRAASDCRRRSPDVQPRFHRPSPCRHRASSARGRSCASWPWR